MYYLGIDVLEKKVETGIEFFCPSLPKNADSFPFQGRSVRTEKYGYKIRIFFSAFLLIQARIVINATHLDLLSSHFCR